MRGGNSGLGAGKQEDAHGAANVGELAVAEAREGEGVLDASLETLPERAGFKGLSGGDLGDHAGAEVSGDEAGGGLDLVCVVCDEVGAQLAGSAAVIEEGSLRGGEGLEGREFGEQLVE